MSRRSWRSLVQRRWASSGSGESPACLHGGRTLVPRVVAILIALIWVGAAVTEIRWYRHCADLEMGQIWLRRSRWTMCRSPGFELGENRGKRRTVVPVGRCPLRKANGWARSMPAWLACCCCRSALVNLDGLANDDIQGEYLGRVGAWPSPALAEYISRERIRYVIDHIPPWTEWETVVGLKTELVMKTER